MKIILSRKGIDDQYGKGASPILPKGEMVSFPIPTDRNKNESGIKYKDLKYGHEGMSFHDLGAELGMKVIKEHQECHLDPDLNEKTLVNRGRNWRGVFGQSGSHQTHLDQQGVGKGDLFLFFGTFKETYHAGRITCFQKQHPRHILFGYLLIEQVLDIPNLLDEEMKQIYSKHPHFANANIYNDKNKVYVGSKSFFDSDKKGYGTFKFREELILTKTGYNKSLWELPKFFHPDFETLMTYHKEKAFRTVGEKVLLQSVGRGQDFVVSGNENVGKWAKDIVLGSELI